MKTLGLMASLRGHRLALGLMVAASVVTAWSCTQAHEKAGVHWTYTGEAGPAHWGALSPDFTACASGQRQSPTDIVPPSQASLGPVVLHYDGATTTVVNNGHAIQLNVEPGNWLEVDGHRSDLAQVHLHSPSEHRIKGEQFPLEAHFVHTGEAGTLTVVSVLYRGGEASALLAGILSTLTSDTREATPFTMPLSAFGPGTRSAYFHYEGSLTTPPCTEGVAWYVLQDTHSATTDQIAAVTRLVGENARPVQPLYGRQVFESAK